MSLESRFRHTCDDALEDNSLLYRRTPSNLGVELQADALTFEYERHRACLSVKTPIDEPSRVPLHARTLRGAALSS